ncbi:MAG: SDR family NAD(P)-dependent oxidoreductase [Gammaproteobacteria bacterium]|nr:SDR family NAD(P)-dependent oxidoreductase [Gammaproteobacteria bacterium]
MNELNKDILITGCSSGIGLCVATQLRKRGYRVLATARQSKDVNNLIASGFESFQLDLNNSESIKKAFHDIMLVTNGKLYGLFNNGAYAQPGAVEDLSRETLRAQFETNLFGWLELTNLAIPVMRKQGFGRIIHNSSILGMIPLKFRGAYVATKFALEGLASTQRIELADTDIKICLIEPGPITSRIRENSLIAFEKNINYKNSVFSSQYEHVLERLKTRGPAMKGTLPPEAVLKRVIHALENPRPKIRYYVTAPTYWIGFLRRVLPYRLMDWLLIKSSKGGKG